MKKLLIITPHLSTGGAPQVTVNKIELLKGEFDIKVVEWQLLAWDFVVQRNRIIDLVGHTNFYSLGDAKFNHLQQIILEFNPDVISMEEFPEMFMTTDCSDYLYHREQPWKIIETTHDSSFNPKNKYYLPHKFIFVSPYNAFKYINLDVPTEVIEYPIDRKERNQVEAMSKLGLELDYKHVVIVGLFTPRKNQEYAFRMAERLKNYKIKFHFLGNQAGNFEFYWKPLMQNKPDNCVIWGERDDVDLFLQASDVFLFPSKGDRGNKELNPIAIKEAMNYNLLKMMYNLDVYCNKYNGWDNLVYLIGNIDVDTTNMIEKLNLSSIDEEVIILGTYPNLKERVRLTKETITSLKLLGRKIILVSHYPVDQEIQRMVDYYIYDDHNPLTHHSYYTKFFNYPADYDVEININGLKDTNQSLTVLTNIFNGFRAAKSLGFRRAFYTTYDVILNEKDVPVVNEAFKSNKKVYVATLPTPFKYGIQTNGMMFNVDFFLNEFDDVRTPEEYNRTCEIRKCQNFLEDYLVKVVDSFNPDDVHKVTNDKETLLVNSGTGTSSNSEYYSILPIIGKPNKYMFYFYTYNVDNREIEVYVDKIMFKIVIANNREHKYEFDYTGNNVIIMRFFDGDNCYKVERFEMNQSTIDRYQNTGFFKWKKKDRPKIKLVHIQTTLNDEREQASRDSLMGVKDYGWKYILQFNEPYKSLPPSHNCTRPNSVSMELFTEQQVAERGTALTPAHYGCYEAFKNAIISEFHDCDFLIVCEGDCLLDVPMDEFINTVEACAHNVIDHGIEFMSFGDKDTLEHGWPQSPIVNNINDVMYETNHIIGLQCIMFPAHTAEWLKNTLRTQRWDAADMYFNIIFSSRKMGIVHKRLTTQADGFSLIDNTEKKFR